MARGAAQSKRGGLFDLSPHSSARGRKSAMDLQKNRPRAPRMTLPSCSATWAPDAPTAPALRAATIMQFLSDPRVVEIPRAAWLPILHGIILRAAGSIGRQVASIWMTRARPWRYGRTSRP